MRARRPYVGCPADLAAVDTLIAAGIAGSRADILRWAVSRIREHPAYAQPETLSLTGATSGGWSRCAVRMSFHGAPPDYR
jgi:hypothetical protein